MLKQCFPPHVSSLALVVGSLLHQVHGAIAAILFSPAGPAVRDAMRCDAPGFVLLVSGMSEGLGRDHVSLLGNWRSLLSWSEEWLASRSWGNGIRLLTLPPHSTAASPLKTHPMQCGKNRRRYQDGLLRRDELPIPIYCLLSRILNLESVGC